jgi:hypothetical protein
MGHLFILTMLYLYLLFYSWCYWTSWIFTRTLTVVALNSFFCYFHRSCFGWWASCSSSGSYMLPQLAISFFALMYNMFIVLAHKISNFLALVIFASLFHNFMDILLRNYVRSSRTKICKKRNKKRNDRSLTINLIDYYFINHSST